MIHGNAIHITQVLIKVILRIIARMKSNQNCGTISFYQPKEYIMTKFYSPRDHEAMVQAYMSNGWTRAAAVRQVDGEEAQAMKENNAWLDSLDNEVDDELPSEGYYINGDLV
jgi:cyclic lactone autoinducer peptide